MAIQFDEDQNYQPRAFESSKPLLIRLVEETGIVSNDKHANYVLVGLAFVAICLALFIAFKGKSKSYSIHPTIDYFSEQSSGQFVK